MYAGTHVRSDWLLFSFYMVYLNFKRHFAARRWIVAIVYERRCKIKWTFCPFGRSKDFAKLDVHFALLIFVAKWGGVHQVK